ALLRKYEEDRLIHGFQIRSEGVHISHLLFADDSVIFCRATEQEVVNVQRALKCYEEGSGQCINYEKSSLFFSNNCPSRRRRKLEALIRIRQKEEFGKYLAGKEVLIKAVAMAMPIYSMSCFKLPIALCKELEREITRFWWKGQKDTQGIHWVAWQKLTQRKTNGGLGFRDLICFNLAMLAKIGWRLVLHSESLLARLLHDKYYPGGSFLSAGSVRGSSWGWKGIL
ncbi:unnamed protein product, partial [Prunus brigantina]